MFYRLPRPGLRAFPDFKPAPHGSFFPRVFVVFVFSFGFFSPPGFAAPVADEAQIREALTPPKIVVGDSDLDRDDLVGFYSVRNYQPAWNFAAEDGSDFLKFVGSLEQLIRFHGLAADDYPLDTLRTLGAPGGEGGIKLELLVTDTLMRLAYDLHGEVQPLSQIYTGWTFHRRDEPIPSNLSAAASANSVNDYIQSLAPQNPAYLALAKGFEEYRAFSERGPWPVIEAGGLLREKDHDRRVVELRSRLIAEDYLTDTKLKKSAEATFDDGLAKALASWQAHHGLKDDGHLGPKTVEALNVPAAFRVDQIRANMERWRHMPDDFPGERYALVNIPEASIDIWDHNQPIFHGDVIVGRVDRKTPFIESAISRMIINPPWHVPSTIAKADILPKLKKDPHYLEKLGFTIKGQEKDPYGVHVNWASVTDDSFNFKLRQDPGDKNSLGRLKFDFDNDFAVYLHGTPHQELFQKSVRDLSSGCVRLKDPEEVGVIVLSGNKDPWTVERLRDSIDSQKTRWVAVANPLPLYILCWTAYPGEDDKLNFLDDVYGYDSLLIALMNNEKINP